ncbi:hypothetical protein BP422_19500 [Brevibacillus formosus]|uniref:DUF418 domain-containing protein n=1 Tax=Brevibacillus formosus TaxID=54913 RepID=A0A220MKF7_9BACL|nr:DUF418 domain-containing protein [Brevibacillus formosus]ASJ55537.1 hypothetical protein BP422_19500 [Brevibacillus formosus]
MNAQPVTKQDRISSIDIIRGLALFFILLVNMPDFYMDFSKIVEPQTEDAWLRLSYDLFIQRKFFTIFSFLFGIGFYIFMSRAEEKGEKRIYLLFIRRLLALLIFGFIHHMIWQGDILRDYAVSGILLLPFYNRKPTTIFTWVAALIVIHFTATVYCMIYFLMPNDGLHMFSAISFFTGTKFQICIMFLLGLYVGKIRIFTRVSQSSLLIRRVQVVSLIISLPLLYGIIWTHPAILLGSTKLQNHANLQTLFVNCSGIPLALLYLSTLVFILEKKRAQRCLQPIRSVGQMALTNYLLQTTIAMVIAKVFGVNISNSLTKDLFISIGIYVIQMVFSVLWLKSFQHGPMELLWRILTYGRIRNKVSQTHVN